MTQSKLLSIVIILTLSICLSTSGYADVLFKSAQYAYTIKIPSGWIRIPDEEIVQRKKSMSVQGQQTIYDAAFQQGKEGGWFTPPYLTIQVIPIGLGRLPTEAEFREVTGMISGGKNIVKVQEAIDTIKDDTKKATATTILSSLSSTTVQVDAKKRNYYYLVDGSHQGRPIKIYTSGTFTPNGNVIQFNCVTSADRFNQDFISFWNITKSFRWGLTGFGLPKVGGETAVILEILPKYGYPDTKIGYIPLDILGRQNIQRFTFR